MPTSGLLARLLQLDELDELRRAASDDPHKITVYDSALARLNLIYEVSEADLSRIPAQGPALVVANHPSGMADGLVIGSLLSRARKDWRVLGNYMLREIGQFNERVIAVDPFGGPDSVRTNARAFREAIQWLRDGGLLATFPAGEVSALRFPEGKVVEPQWQESVGRLIRKTGACAVPVFINATNSMAFQMLGLLNARFRTALLARELMNKQGKRIQVAVGRPLPASALSHRCDREATDHLRWRTEILQHRRQVVFSASVPAAPVTAPTPAAMRQQELDSLPLEQRLLEHGDFQVFYAQARQIPETLREIGRLREVAFRAAGEGTGHDLDLDVFDQHYLHLLVWDRVHCEIAGAYRFVATDDVVKRFGPQGLYTSTLFRFKREFITQIGPALELGRSFVHPGYQKNFWPLLLLWKGIGAYVARNPRYRILFGPVSISAEYSEVSRSLMAAFLKAQHTHSDLAGVVKARRKVHFHRLPALHARAVSEIAADVDQISDAIADLEPDGKGIPVLLRQYLSLGGQIVDFNVDRAFSNVLDGLIVVDLRRTNSKLLERYMGKPGARSFLDYHGVPAVTSRGPDAASAST